MRVFYIFLMGILFLNTTEAQNSLSVKILGVKNTSGMLRVALYESETTFLKFEGVAANASAKAVKGITTVRLENIPDGYYAAVLFHDKNNNKTLDKNWIGIPTEPLGFSMATLRTFGPPKFEDCLFLIDTNKEISITLENNN